jgi:hypothetical protein
LSSSESELQQTPPPTPTDELSEVSRAAQALVDALKGLAQVKIQSATDLTEETHHSMEKRTDNKSLAKPLSERIERSLLILLALAIFLLFFVPVPVL